MKTSEEIMDAFKSALADCRGVREGEWLFSHYSPMDNLEAIQESLESILGLLYSLQFVAHTGAKHSKQAK